jgi:hypothetical protein
MSTLIRQGDANLAAFGQLGNAITTAGAAFTTLPAGRVIVAITPLTAVTGITATGETASFPNLSSVAVPVGATIYGRYTSVTSAGGPAIVYFG